MGLWDIQKIIKFSIYLKKCYCLGYRKNKNPALQLFRVTGFLGNRRPFLILFRYRVERRNLVREYC